jgi:hypothetical protein
MSIPSGRPPDKPKQGSTNRTPRPVTGSVRWLLPLHLPLGIGRLAITNAAGVEEEYDVGAHVEGEQVVGFRLVKDDDEGYDLFTLAPRWSCSCPHFTFHGHRDPKGCEHVAALRAALAAAGLLDHLAGSTAKPLAVAPAPAAAAQEQQVLFRGNTNGGWDEL